MLKNDVKKKKGSIKKTETNKQNKLDKKKVQMRSAHFFLFNNTIDVTLPSPNKARDA